MSSVLLLLLAFSSSSLGDCPEDQLDWSSYGYFQTCRSHHIKQALQVTLLYQHTSSWNIMIEILISPPYVCSCCITRHLPSECPVILFAVTAYKKQHPEHFWANQYFTIEARFLIFDLLTSLIISLKAYLLRVSITWRNSDFKCIKYLW